MKKVPQKDRKLLDVLEEILPWLIRSMIQHGEPITDYPLASQLMDELREEYQSAAKEEAKNAGA